MISLGKMEIVMLLMTYPQKCVFLIKQKTNIKEFTMVTRINKVKTVVNHISYDCKCKFSSATSNSSQKWNNVKCQWQ